MTVSDEQFKRWLGHVQHDYGDRVLNVREEGRSRLNCLYIGRAMRTESPDVGRFGNPFYETQHGRFGAIKQYVKWLQSLPEQERSALLGEVREALLAGKKLLCWCSSPDKLAACHGHVLAGWALALPAPERERSEPAKQPVEEPAKQSLEASPSLEQRLEEESEWLEDEPLEPPAGQADPAPETAQAAGRPGPRFARSGR